MSLTTEEVFVNQKLINAPTSNLRLRVFMILLLVGGLTLFGTFQFGAESQQGWRTNALKGKVAMTEVQLKNLVVTEKIAVYWTGPIANNLYTLDTSKKNQSILTYLSQKSKDKKAIASSRVIGTYFSPSAFSDSLNVATKANNVSFKNANGNLVFYSRDRETGVFVAIPNTNYQIEIFDPIPGQAISIATLRDQLTKIGS